MGPVLLTTLFLALPAAAALEAPSTGPTQQAETASSVKTAAAPGTAAEPGGQPAAAEARASAVSAEHVTESAAKVDAAPGDSGRVPPPPSVPVVPEKPRFRFHGFLAPAFFSTYNPTTMPADAWEYGFSGLPAGLGLSGEPLRTLRFDVLLLLTVGAIPGTSSRSINRDNWLGKVMDTATMTYEPAEQLNIKAGLFRMPWDLTNRFANSDPMFMTNLMFPACGASNRDCTQDASNWGASINGSLLRKRIQATAGIFGGRKGLSIPAVEDRYETTAFAGRVDLHPLGDFAFDEDDKDRGPLRMGVGTGMLYRATSLLDGSGRESVNSADARMSATVRTAFRGLYVQAEYLRYQRTSSHTDDEPTAAGVYAQASYYVPALTWLAIKPMARVGFSGVRSGAHESPRKNTLFDGGLAFYPSVRRTNPNALRFIVQYSQRTNEIAKSRGVETSLQFAW